ncbi:MAG: hypothetical protein M3P06_21530 [Acidobacteriota bacterium]|nr:hypothetical protein [Acidobacteriota bacterium]
MVEEILVKEALTERMIDAGAELTTSLDRAQWPVVASFWLFEPENNQWQLDLASPRVLEEGPLAAYRQIHEVLRTTSSPLPLESIAFVTPGDALVQAFRSVYRTNRDLEGRRAFRGAINGRFIDDAYLYRVMPVAPAA